MRIIFLLCIWFLIQVSSKEVKAEERDNDLSEIKVQIYDFNKMCI